VSFALDLEAMRTSFESHGIHRSRLLFVPRAPLSDETGVLMAVSAAAAADVVVDFSASSVYALAVAAPVSSCALPVVNYFLRLLTGTNCTSGLACSSRCG
jgi:hypothetical protein